jgi:hypothetical protein
VLRDREQRGCGRLQTHGALRGNSHGTFGVIQGTFGVIQGTFGVIQGTFGVIQGTFGDS